MEENNNKIVYITTFGKKFHFNINCQYVKGKDYKEIPLNEARQKFEGACVRCMNKNNNVLNINNEQLRNDNQNLNIVQNNKNNNYFFHKNNFYKNSLSNNKNIFQNDGNNINLNHIQIEKEDEKSEVSKFSESQKNYKFSDFLSSSNSLSIKEKYNKMLFEEKSDDINFNNFNIISEQDKKTKFKFNGQNNYPINISNFINKSEKENENSLKLSYDNHEKIKIEEYEDDIINDQNNSDEFINSDKKNRNNDFLFHENNIIKNNKNEINSFVKRNISNLNYIPENKVENFNIINPTKAQKFNSFYIHKDDKAFSKNKKYINYISSSSSSNERLGNKNFFKEKNNFIKIIKETFQNSITLPIINNKNFSKKIFNENDKMKNGNFKFSFKINPKKENKININIELGFKIIYGCENDSCSNSEEESSESSKDSISVNNKYQKYYILNQLNIRKKTNNINVLINISKGKFFIVRTQQNINNLNYTNLFLEKKNILSISNFQKIPLENIIEIKPIFKYDCVDLNNVDIVFNNFN